MTPLYLAKIKTNISESYFTIYLLITKRINHLQEEAIHHVLPIKREDWAYPRNIHQ
ncbi:hypothetical protein GU271_17815 [Vibrio cholerae]|nr:hypothetical protein [Vibrio paracholerae]NOE58469.1 hypothetical protein [Vibrio cholerae]NOF43194.1 hypothetical protein [Vibrio cholerae]